MPTLEDRLTRIDRRAVIILVGYALLLATQISPWWNPTRDGLNYLSISRSIADGRFERLGEPHLHYAPGYSVLISPAFLTGERPFLAISIIHWLFAVGIMLGVFYWTRRVATTSAALLITGLVVLSTGFWDHLRTTQSEVAFMAAWIATLLAMERLAAIASNREPRAGSLRAILCYAALATILLIVTSLIRHVGIFLAAGLGVRMLILAWTRALSWTRAITLTLAIGLTASAALLALIAYDQNAAEATEKKSYVEYFSGDDLSIVSQVHTGFRLRFEDIGRLTVPGMFKAYRPGWINPNTPIYLVMIVLISIGWWRLARRNGDIFALTAPFYLALYIFWPFGQETRYVFPLLPLLFLCFWCAIESAQRHRLSILAILLAAHLLIAIGYTIVKVRDIARDNRLWAALETMAPQLSEEQLSAPVVTRRSYALWLMFQFEIDRPTEHHRQFEDLPHETQWVLTTTSTPMPDTFVARQQAGDVVLLERKRVDESETLE